MTRSLVDIDDEFLEKAREELGTEVLEDTVNDALRLVVANTQRWCRITRQDFRSSAGWRRVSVILRS